MDEVALQHMFAQCLPLTERLETQQFDFICTEGNLKIEYQATTLSLHKLSIEKRAGVIARVKHSQQLETHFRNPQLNLWRLSDTEWLLALRRMDQKGRKSH